jgi:Tfp pilus assembly protein PilN
MINLLPPQIKEQIGFSKRNRTLLNYVVVVGILELILAGGFVGARIYLNQRTSAATEANQGTSQEIAKFKDLQTQSKSVNDRLVSVQKIQQTQSKFSQLLSDLAAATPRGVALSSIALTGDDKKPVRVTATAVDYKTALSFRDSIAQSPRISAADIESFSTGDKGQQQITITFAFKPGSAK